ncbi:MAG: branched-chain amino acid ABC transporter substrate-binding protein [Acidibrevibacterium sp.]|jgi:branched-chain amino acid transport system substrate-binding protein|uniref:branched-chain amino acid ABC transporter substrate-binding protein n=1 Tax=Acidibrevibacterium fodinaquatile TaxID=1969806 RepID=UPI0023A8ED43|nr:branched-chain amino acid ABC transporter substrate-binding protein [Acidibrevibacterium fodinaquatile]MCA7120310.1 branched-chain amino acid ABC transporter substrate-binding protein [Acidibrevibacterium fodinaquatile]
MRFTKAVVLGTVAAGALLAGPAVTARADEVVRIAYIDPMSGPFASTGRLGEQHFRFAIDRVNAAHAAGNRTFELVVMDNEVSPEKSLTMFRKAVDDGIHYITQGNGSSVAFALSDATAKNNRRDPEHAVLYLNYAAVDPALTNEKCNWWHFRFDADSDMKMKALADYIVASPNIHKVYVFNQDYSFGQSVEKAAVAMIGGKRADLAIVGTERVPLGKVTDFTPYIAKMRAAGADAVVTGAWGADLTLLVKAAADTGFPATFFTYYLGARETVQAVGMAGKGDAQISEWHENVDAPAIDRMAAEFKAKYNENFYYWRVVDMIDTLAAAMKKADSSDPLKVGKVLSGMKFDTPLGPEEIRADNHQLLQPMYVSILAPDMPHMFPGVPLGFKTIKRFDAEETRLPTTCAMKAPG